jgi:hypothetical protein
MKTTSTQSYAGASLTREQAVELATMLLTAGRDADGMIRVTLGVTQNEGEIALARIAVGTMSSAGVASAVSAHHTFRRNGVSK